MEFRLVVLRTVEAQVVAPAVLAGLGGGVEDRQSRGGCLHGVCRVGGEAASDT